jgi:N-acetylneuraminate synthase/N,N'-diacetyllegionaminate synthase
MAKKVQVGSRVVGDGEPCFVIAEAGVNHNGDVDRARKLVASAARCGADAVKFQKRTVDDILVAEALERPYQHANSLGATYGEHRRRLELDEHAWEELAATAGRQSIILLASAWDCQSADFLDRLGVPAFKTASADLTNLPLLAHIARKQKPMIVSTGMSTLDEVAQAVETIRKFHDQLVLLHCVSAYPCENDVVNLRVMETLRRTFDVPIGYSGHERGIAIPVAAATLGAVVVEKHFTLDRTLPGPDHAASLEPAGLERLVHYIRVVEAAMGDGEKRFLDAEKPVRARLAKSVVTRCDILRGTPITEAMLTLKGPGTGLPARRLRDLCGRIARVDLKRDTVVPPDAVEW